MERKGASRKPDDRPYPSRMSVEMTGFFANDREMTGSEYTVASPEGTVRGSDYLNFLAQTLSTSSDPVSDWS
jgi:hypothetical protein